MKSRSDELRKKLRARPGSSTTHIPSAGQPQDHEEDHEEDHGARFPVSPGEGRSPGDESVSGEDPLDLEWEKKSQIFKHIIKELPSGPMKNMGLKLLHTKTDRGDRDKYYEFMTHFSKNNHRDALLSQNNKLYQAINVIMHHVDDFKVLNAIGRNLTPDWINGYNLTSGTGKTHKNNHKDIRTFLLNLNSELSTWPSLKFRGAIKNIPTEDKPKNPTKYHLRSEEGDILKSKKSKESKVEVPSANETVQEMTERYLRRLREVSLATHKVKRHVENFGHLSLCEQAQKFKDRLRA